MRSRDQALLLATFVAVLGAELPQARACGCLSPPAPAIGESSYAINQSAEQIIFETEPGWVTAHVLIRYAGDPAKFAWLIPVPEVPELGISPVSAFGLIDRATAPAVSVQLDDLCPISAWACAYHDQSSCGGFAEGDSGGTFLSDGGASADGAGGSPVTVIDEQVVGDYQTVTFRASEAAAATQWLRDNGFIVNPTTSIYMESYVQANMVFVAAKLVPGAGVSSIKPLRLRYRAAFPTVPLILTAVAAEPNLTVTSFIYADKPFRPQGHPVVTIAPDRLAYDNKNRLNYPMVLARTIDEAGGDAFAIEYSGYAGQANVGQNYCCSGGMYDYCGLGNNGQCECPRDGFDQADCAKQGDLVDGVALVDALAAAHPLVTRLTTRVSAEEMTFDPAFEPAYGAATPGPMLVTGKQPSLGACRGEVIDKAKFNELDALQGCAAMYCGPHGKCMVTASGPGCACDPSFVVQRYNDLDGSPSVTCVPETPPVDLGAGGQQLPDACKNLSCGLGRCIDRNGIAVCACDAGAAAVAGAAVAPRCDTIKLATATPGAEDYSEPLRDLSVCAPPPPVCGSNGWLVHAGSSRPGVDCGNATPPAALTVPTPAPSCGGPFGCGGCEQTPGTSPVPFAAGAWVVLAMIVRRRRGRSR